MIEDTVMKELYVFRFEKKIRYCVIFDKDVIIMFVKALKYHWIAITICNKNV